MVTRQFAPEHQEGESLTAGTLSYAQTGRGQTAVWTPQENMCMNVLAVGQQSTVQTPVQPLRPEIRTPLIADEWETALTNTGLINRYPRIPHFICHGSDAGIPPIFSTFTPSNHPSITSNQHIFHEIVNMEFKKGCYWGPFSKTELKCLIGPFQTLPLSLIPKPGKPGKFCLVQKLSYPRNLLGICSINHSIESDLYPCTWGTFTTTATLIRSLPPGSMGAC